MDSGGEHGRAREDVEDAVVEQRHVRGEEQEVDVNESGSVSEDEMLKHAIELAKTRRSGENSSSSSSSLGRWPWNPGTKTRHLQCLLYRLKVVMTRLVVLQRGRRCQVLVPTFPRRRRQRR